MRGITLQEPWASLVALRKKEWETRSWSTSYRGVIAIHASQAFPPAHRELLQIEPFHEALQGVRQFHTGCILALAYLSDCLLCRPSTAEAVGYPQNAFGNFAPGRFRFRFTEVRVLAKPFPYRGALSLWAVPPEIAIRLHVQAGESPFLRTPDGDSKK